jgi:hypothetical protein
MIPKSTLPRARFFLRAIFLPTVLAGVAAVLAAQPPAHVRLPAAARGAQAIEALGAHLPAVARAYGLEAQQLATMFRTQPSLGVDPAGALTFACDGLAVRPAGGATAPGHAITAGSSTAQLAAGSAVDAFQLHSLPGATRVIYLDFNGHTTSGTIWNSSFTGGAAIASAPFDLDGDPTTFNDAERGAIPRFGSAWRRTTRRFRSM